MARLRERFETALVTGSSSGFGYALTRMLLSEGLRVVGVCRHPDAFSEEPNYSPVVCDLSDETAVSAMLDSVFSQHPEIDLVVNNAGFGILAELSESETSAIRKQYAVMLHSPTLIAAKATRHFKTKTKAGAKPILLQVSSLAAELPLPLMPVYNACKAGLSALSESLLLDEVEERFGVIDLRLGDFNTGFAAHMEGRTDWAGVDLRAIMDAHHARAPEIQMAVAKAHRLLNGGGNSVHRVGEFFQAKVAPLGPRLLPRSVLRALIRNYFRR